jgi:hypothetical protein
VESKAVFGAVEIPCAEQWLKHARREFLSEVVEQPPSLVKLEAVLLGVRPRVVFSVGFWVPRARVVALNARRHLADKIPQAIIL